MFTSKLDCVSQTKGVRTAEHARSLHRFKNLQNLEPDPKQTRVENIRKPDMHIYDTCFSFSKKETPTETDRTAEIDPSIIELNPKWG